MNTATRAINRRPNPVKFTEQAIRKFFSTVNTNGPLPDQSNPHYHGLDPCHIWTGNLYPTGYGQAYLDRRGILAHRAAMIIDGHLIPPRMIVMHLCDRESCVNPNHLKIGTQKENIEDKTSKGRGATGDKNGARKHPERMSRGDDNGSRKYPERLKRGIENFQARLTDDDVRQIRARYIPWRMSCAMLGKEFGVTPSIINRIIQGKIWRHVS